MNNEWTCITCHITIKSASKYKHMKTKKHLVNLNPNHSNHSNHSNQPNRSNEQVDDCTICMEPMNAARRCRSCHQSWCRKCDRKMPKCPYCRELIPGRNLQATVQARENYNWYASSDAFVPVRQPVAPSPPQTPPTPQRLNQLSQMIRTVQSNNNEVNLNLLIDFIRFIERNDYTHIFD